MSIYNDRLGVKKNRKNYKGNIPLDLASSNAPQIQKEKVNESEHSNASWEIFRKQKGLIPGTKQERQMREQFELHQSLKDGMESSNNIVSEGVMPTASSSTQDLLNRAYRMSMQYILIMI